ncbi:MAG: hypothetical protein HQM16_18470, partial [Deltaproteobacteria bacterium]|nr:hypothetical protein [Deltaproteobacteria bacterium]
MKKIIIACFVVITSLCLSLVAEASCFVSTSVDSASNIDSLRYKVKSYNGFEADYADCDAYGSDAALYDQAIKFTTEEMGAPASTTVTDNTIAVSSKYTIGNPVYSLVIGNPALSDGIVILNARAVSGDVFDCKSGSKNITLRNMLVLTNGRTKADLLTESCLREGSNLVVCPAGYSQNADGTYRCAVEAPPAETACLKVSPQTSRIFLGAKQDYRVTDLGKAGVLHVDRLHSTMTANDGRPINIGDSKKITIGTTTATPPGSYPLVFEVLTSKKIPLNRGRGATTSPLSSVTVPMICQKEVTLKVLSDECLTGTTRQCGATDVGACEYGTQACVAGKWGACEGAIGSKTEVCDGADNDCDGSVDEDYVSRATTCGTGACAATGATSCVGGAVVDSCAAGTPAANDASCDGIDNDCNGSVDEDYVQRDTACGVGVCARTGRTSCTGGVVRDSCVAGMGSITDATCDGVDNDCNGVADEDYPSAATVCGVGACVSTGRTTCNAGTVSNSCTAGTPAADDATCDGIDNDCNGVIDEDYDTVSTSCGVGACAATGTTECRAGIERDNCSPGSPATNDASCDGIDNNCNGATDEGYTSVSTTCGVGPCAATGTTECRAGTVINSCTAGTPAADDATCDSIDDDCNGVVDDTDTDSDGVANCHEVCDDDPLKTMMGICGCGVADTDTDLDGTADCTDECDEDAAKIAAGICGCGVADTDT